nr:PREDICTED: E3 ubiquitin/ISG15 ligase TRIM25-like [Lepisosteus oculatus]
MSGSTTPENLLESELTCPVCLDIFRDPRLLPCGHNLCLLCVQELRKQRGNGQSFSCPECRQECAPDAALQKNRKLANIAEEFRKNRGEDPAAVFCDCCLQKTAAVRLCLKCEVALCGDHVRLHTERPAFRDHTLTELGQDPAKRKCPEHGEVFRFYCVQDEAALCSSCTVQRQHKGHDMKTYKELAEEFKGSLEDLLQRVNGKLSENQKLLTEQERNEKMITVKSRPRL